jgi:outer membrane protein assembly factor BamB
MDSKNILIFGSHGSLRAYRRDTGEVLWSTHLKSYGFVSFVADEQRVYAYTNGELFCVDLFTGDGRWNDALKGWGFDVASLGFPGGASAPDPAIKAMQDAAAAAATTQNGAVTGAASHGH